MRYATALVALPTLMALTISGPGRSVTREPHPGPPAFTQSGVSTVFGSGIPMGHEWLTRLAALELLGGDPVLEPDPSDPRLNWTRGLARNTDLSSPEAVAEVARITAQHVNDRRYQSAYEPVLDAIVGERWVDIGGFNVSKAQLGKCDCFDAVAQEPVDVQCDHFMRRHDDVGGQGGVDAAIRSQERFVEHFVNAATAPRTAMQVWDGGAYSAVVEVDRNYFLFGRAAHLFQDSFSPEHTVRLPEDNHERVRQVKSYLCALGSEQHTHSNAAVLDYTSGDVIWNPGTRLNLGWSSYQPRYMKPVALVATEATKDLWAAFIRTMGHPEEARAAVARAEARALVDTWLSFDPDEMRTWYDDESRRGETYVLAPGQTGRGRTQSECMVGLGVASGDQAEKVRQLEADRRLCLYNIEAVEGYADLSDPYLRIPFHWKWKSSLKWQTPPADWRIPAPPADSGIRVKIRSVANGAWMSAPDGVRDDAWIYCRPGEGEPLEFIVVGGVDRAWLRLANADLFLSYEAVTGAVKLHDSPTHAAFAIRKAGDAWTLENLYWKQHLWLKGESPYISRKGLPDQARAQWVLAGLPGRD